jgi:hypothetical protein
MNIKKLEQTAKPSKGFTQRRWLQAISEDFPDTFHGFNGTDEAIHKLCVAKLQLNPELILLVLDGSADKANVQAKDVLAEYRTDEAAIGADKQSVISAKDVAKLVGSRLG